jgi:subtilase family serine protease
MKAARRSRHSLFATGFATVLAAATLAPSLPAIAAPHQSQRRNARVCAHRSGLFAACNALAWSTDGIRPAASITPPAGAYAPADLASAYRYPSPAGSSWSWNGRTIALVDAYNNPNAASNLAVYRATYGLPPCTTASGCFKVMNESGGSKLPSGNTSWGEEIDLDIQMASAVCPNCKIQLVEASSASLADLMNAENQAAKTASAISNSWGSTAELGPFGSYFDGAFYHKGVAITAGTGDSGYNGSWPSDVPSVIAVGGTSLVRSSNARGWTESAWSGGGSWCSDYEAQPSWQAAAVNATAAAQHAPVCVNRVTADVSADADPNTGVAVYDSYGSSGGANWYEFGGTSVATPIIASLYALAGDHIHDAATPYPARATYNAWYANHGVLNDPVSGSNGDCGTDPAYMCNAGPGWDAPTGLGTPSGLAGF